MLGKEGVELVSQLAGQATGKGTSRDKYWGELVTKTIPRASVGPLVDQLKRSFMRHFAVRGGASWIGKALPFGIGAAVGGAGNNILGRRVLVELAPGLRHPACGLPLELEPRLGATGSSTPRAAASAERAARSSAASPAVRRPWGRSVAAEAGREEGRKGCRAIARSLARSR